ncbi:hypothetical protein H6F86_20735 [Phormidium sp. FACHB-592]|uniref:Uncharacterized protein n=1 Tax=Stenomitos frigidus AS-A4 TaxID=2933935 RepID=A0ABV0KEN4_9CYAN|nr:hypothetical protein [Phormidium sp. FACHB-592]MBD2076260.1 hypothetical protein [Phormidium sp. FACHB-592]
MPSIKVTTYIPPSIQTGPFTFAIGQEVSGVVFNSGSPALATIPLNSVVPFPVGVQIPVLVVGAGQLTFSPASNVFLGSPDNKRKSRVIGSPAVLQQTELNVWWLSGDLVA